MAARDVEDFAIAGRALFSFGLVKGSEGNLSTFDGTHLSITRTGAALAELSNADVLEGTLDRPPGGASSDLPMHLERYRSNGPGAVAHAHPPGTVPSGWVEGEPHGVYEFAQTLAAAVEAVVDDARSRT